MKKSFIIKNKVWKWPGDGGWYFVTLDKKMYEQIRKIHLKGMVAVEAKLGKTVWFASLFPHKYSSSYILCIRKSVRKAEGILEDDEVKVKIKVL